MRAADCLKLLLFTATLSAPSLFVQQPCIVLADSGRGFATTPAGAPASVLGGDAAAAVAAAFDLETDAVTDYIIFDYLGPGIFFTGIGVGDASLILRWTTMIHLAWFDATAPYHPTAVGVYSDLGRRPEIESATNANIAVAVLFSSHKILSWCANLPPGFYL